VDAFPRSSRLTRPSEAAEQENPASGMTREQYPAQYDPAGRLLRRGGAVVSPPPEPAAIVVARLRLGIRAFGSDSTGDFRPLR
jgi:hypothetical protein